MLKLNGEQIHPTIFPDGTSQVWKTNVSKYPVDSIEWEFSHEAEFIHLAQLVTLLKHLKKEVHLHMPFLPYARQDKDVYNISTFALHTFAALLNSLDISLITIVDPHSIRALELIKNSKAVYPLKEISKVMKLTDTDIVCYPDYGAYNKYKTAYAGIKTPIVTCSKVRDATGGEIVGLKIFNDQTLDDKRILILDDICDGGATFIKVAELLKEKGAKEIHLFVTHGLFTKGVKPLFDAGIKRIFDKRGEIKIGFKDRYVILEEVYE